MAKEVVEGQRYGMVIDLDRCTGCGTCTIACAAENNLTVRPDESDRQRSIAWMRLYQITNGKPFPETEVCYFPAALHALPSPHPVRLRVPGHGHRDRLPHGLVSQIYTRCIGCRYCMAACPYHARVFNWWDGYFPKGKGLEQLPLPGGFASAAGGGGKMHLLPPSPDAGQDPGLHRRPPRPGGRRIHHRLRRGVPGPGHHLRRPEQLRTPGRPAEPRAPMPSGFWNDWEPIPRCTTSPASDWVKRTGGQLPARGVQTPEQG